MRKSTVALTQVQCLVDAGCLVQIERTTVPCEYEVTVFEHGTHTHHGGETLDEAVNRAFKAHHRSAHEQTEEK